MLITAKNLTFTMKIQIRFFHYRLFIEIINRKARNYPTEEQKKQSFTAKKLWDSRWKNRQQKMKNNAL